MHLVNCSRIKWINGKTSSCVIGSRYRTSSRTWPGIGAWHDAIDPRQARPGHSRAHTRSAKFCPYICISSFQSFQVLWRASSHMFTSLPTAFNRWSSGTVLQSSVTRSKMRPNWVNNISSLFGFKHISHIEPTPVLGSDIYNSNSIDEEELRLQAPLTLEAIFCASCFYSAASWLLNSQLFASKEMNRTSGWR